MRIELLGRRFRALGALSWPMRAAVRVNRFGNVLDFLADFAHGRMHFLDQLVFLFRQGLNPLSLLAQLMQNRGLTGGDAMH